MTEKEAKSLNKGDIILYHGEECEVLHIHKNPILVECKTINHNRKQWHLVRPGTCRLIPS